MVDKKEATRVARAVKVGGKVHRLVVVLESDRLEGRYYVDDVCVAPREFDRIMALAMMPEEQV
jgi:hypothetical protein